VQEALPELALMRGDRLPAQRLDVLDGCDESGQELVLHRPGLVARRGADLVRAPAVEELPADESEPEMRAVELVRRAEKDVGADRGHVDRTVWRVMHRVHPPECPPAVGA